MDKAKIEDLEDALKVERLLDNAHDHQLISYDEFTSAKATLKNMAKGFVDLIIN